MKHRVLGIGSMMCLLMACTTPEPPTPTPSDHPLRGTDFSQLPKIEAYNYEFKDADGNPADALEILRNNGLNLIRLKVWNNPTGDGSLEELVPYVQRLKTLGFQTMLTFHYSNTWADPGAQSVPAQWENLSMSELADSVRTFTQHVVATLQPEYVQIGNEINHGFMHPFGMRNGNGNFQTLLAAGIEGAKAADSSVTTILHYAGYDNAMNFYATVDSLNYDWIGLSYYPKWHGTSLSTLSETCFSLADSFQRPVSIVETSYAFTLGWNDWTNNHIGSSSDLHPDYPATPEGQADLMADLRAITDSLGTGLVYWGGELVAYKGPEATDGSPYENQALFNFQGIALPALKTLGLEP